MSYISDHINQSSDIMPGIALGAADYIEWLKKEKKHYIDVWSDVCDENQGLRNEIEQLEKEAEDFHMAYQLKCDVETKMLHEELEESKEVAHATLCTLNQLRVESQAQNAKLREAIIEAHRWSPDKSASKHLLGEAMYLPHDDTALKEFKRKVLLDAAEVAWNFEPEENGPIETELRRMAEEV